VLAGHTEFVLHTLRVRVYLIEEERKKGRKETLQLKGILTRIWVAVLFSGSGYLMPNIS
jgi:hypothetical protein